MKRIILACASILVASSAGLADERATAPAGEPADRSATESDGVEAEPAPAETQAPGGPVKMSGMSILGNEEAPKALVIVPWKSSELGNGTGLEDTLDDRARPVDKEVFMRELEYYALRSGE